MKPEQIRDEVGKLELSEKLLLVEDIWDSIAVSNSEIVVHSVFDNRQNPEKKAITNKCTRIK